MPVVSRISRRIGAITGISLITGAFSGEGIIAFGNGMPDDVSEQETSEMSEDAKKDLKKRKKAVSE